MISNGYGQMSYKSNLIYHSNLLIGFLGGQLPSIYGILPYNYINIVFLIISYVTINEIVFKKINNFFVSYLIVISSSFFILVTPTYSTIAGYLGIAGLLKIIETNSGKNNKNSVAIFVGPEGGWSNSDREFFAGKNMKTVSLGVTVLRAETAAIVGSVAACLG
jgi:hypothetical protein